MTTKDAIKHLSDKIDYAEQCDDKWVDSVSIKALYIAVRAMAGERNKGKWKVCGTFGDFLKCSCCGYKKPWNEDVFNFCPICGAEMSEENINGQTT